MFLSNCVLDKRRFILSRSHAPRRRDIQYAAAARFKHWRLWNTGSPAFAGDDSRVGSATEGFISMPAHSQKAELRAKALAARDALSEKKRTTAATKLAKRGLPFTLLPGSIVSGYSPIRSEIDPMPLMKKLAEAGAKLALPCVSARGQSLIFRIFHPNDRLMLGPLGIPEPSPADAACGLRPSRPSHRLRCGPLRPHLRASAQGQADRRHRARFCGAGDQGGSGTIARRRAGLCANGIGRV
jgi:5-formyltetrahydrofolate cyclo-ligase family